MLCIYGIFRGIKYLKKKHTTARIVHNKKNDPDSEFENDRDARSKYNHKPWVQNKGKPVVITSASNVNMVSSDDKPDPDSPKSKSGSRSRSALNMNMNPNDNPNADIQDGSGLATKFLNLQPIQKNKIEKTTSDSSMRMMAKMWHKIAQSTLYQCHYQPQMSNK